VCSHARKALCVWDLRCMAYAVHEEALDLPRLLQWSPSAGRDRLIQGTFLSSHEDILFGQDMFGAIPRMAC
jgi:hypothetical protein